MPTASVYTDLDFQSVNKLTNLPAAVANGQAVTYEQLNSAVEGLSWKDACRVATQSNLNTASPGATIDGITMATNDRVLVRAQSIDIDNGIYIWNGAATPMTRSSDASTGPELEGAVVTVEEGTSAGVTYRQTQVNFVINVGSVIWTTFGTSAPPASESTAGIAEIATQAETDTGTDDTRIVSPLKLANYSGRKLKYAANFGDGSSTSYAINHNLNTRDVTVEVFLNSGNYDTILCEVERTSVNQVTLIVTPAPASNALRVVVMG